MPDYLNLGIAKPFTLKPGQWDSIEFTSEWNDTVGQHVAGSSVFAKGPARFTGSVSLAFSGLPVGHVVQARMSEYQGDTHRIDHPVHEVIGTPGDSYGVVSLTKRLGAGRGMRVRLLNQSAKPVTVTSAVLTALVFKESRRAAAFPPSYGRGTQLMYAEDCLREWKIHNLAVTVTHLT
ncbi:hypothetical protein ACWDE9_42610 [Streptomyces olivaceoviridis]